MKKKNEIIENQIKSDVVLHAPPTTSTSSNSWHVPPYSIRRTSTSIFMDFLSHFLVADRSKAEFWVCKMIVEFETREKPSAAIDERRLSRRHLSNKGDVGALIQYTLCFSQTPAVLWRCWYWDLKSPRYVDQHCGKERYRVYTSPIVCPIIPSLTTSLLLGLRRPLLVFFGS